MILRVLSIAINKCPLVKHEGADSLLQLDPKMFARLIP